MIMEASTPCTTMIGSVIVTVGLWWIANAIATIASKSVMRGDEVTVVDDSDFTSAFQDLRWVDITALQHLVGAIISTIWIKAKGKSVWPSQGFSLNIIIATLGNVIGNLTTNAAYALIASSTAQVVKACEPLFTFGFTVLLYKNYTSLDISTLLSVVIVVVGAVGFIVGDSTFNIWGIVAGIIANTAFPIRNIYLKNLSKVWDSAYQKYAIISIYSVLVLLPVLAIKAIANWKLASIRLSESFVSSIFHCTYNIASIKVLESFSPVTHAVLNISKRIFVFSANVTYFYTPVSVIMMISLLVLLVGCYLYQIKKKFTMFKVILLAMFLVYLYVSRSNFHNDESNSLQDHVERGIIPMDQLKERWHGFDNRLSIAWVYDRPIPDNVVTNIVDLLQQAHPIQVHIYCGLNQCVDAFSKVEGENLIIEFLVATDIVKGTLLDSWMAHHTLNKVLARRDFENHLHDAVRLGILWKYGGVYIDPTVRITNVSIFYSKCLDMSDSNACVTKQNYEDDSIPDFLSVSYFSRNHPFIRKLIELFVKKYPTKGNKDASFNFNFKKEVWNIIGKTTCSPCPAVTNSIKLERISIPEIGRHYGTMSYDVRVRQINASNLGDEVQCFPGMQFLPFVDHLVERDDLKASKGNDNITTFFNAWWGDEFKTFSWPPPNNINPVMLSLHIHSHVRKVFLEHIDFLKQKEPIGCRDSSTSKFLRSNGVKAFLSGCMTLLIRNPNLNQPQNQPRNNKIYLTDLSSKFFDILPEDIKDNGIVKRHGFNFAGSYAKERTNMVRFSLAYDLLKEYGSAKLVITQRIHCALPCVAMGTPVILINDEYMPGGGLETKEYSRISGLSSLFHTLDMYKLGSMEKAKEWLDDFPWDDIPPNPHVGDLMRFRATMWNVIRRDQAMYDTAKKFGVIPMSLPPIQAGEISSLVFHLIFTESSELFSWRHWRSLESILHHHATAEVIVHSNTLSQDTFSVLTEISYKVKVQKYDLKELLRDSPAENFKLERARKRSYWHSDEADLLQLLILYRTGGVYLSKDIVLVRPIDSLKMNSLGWEDRMNRSLNDGFMIFDKENSFLESCLRGFVNHYNGISWVGNGPLLTRTFREVSGGREVVQAIDHLAFNSISHSSLKNQCLNVTSGPQFDSNKKVLTTYAYGLDISFEDNDRLYYGKNSLIEGTLCSYVLNSFCVLCSNLY